MRWLSSGNKILEIWTALCNRKKTVSYGLETNLIPPFTLNHFKNATEQWFGVKPRADLLPYPRVPLVILGEEEEQQRHTSHVGRKRPLCFTTSRSRIDLHTTDEAGRTSDTIVTERIRTIFNIKHHQAPTQDHK